MADDEIDGPPAASEDEDAGDGEEAAPEAAPSRDRDLLGTRRSKIRKRLDDIFTSISAGFEAQAKRSDDLDDWWDCYNCELSRQQFYNGNAQIYVPIIRDAVNARVTRFSNQLFPPSGHLVDVVSTDGSQPFEIVALIDHYLRQRRFKTQVVKPLLRNGDIEGQYNLYVDWAEFDRQVVSRETRGPTITQDGEKIDTEGDEIEDIREEDVVEGSPMFEVLHDSDVLVLPATADGIDEALMTGGSVTIVRRWSKEKIDQMIAAGEIRKAEGEDLKDLMMAGGSGDMPGLSDQEKALVKAVGIRATGKFAMVFETWTMLPLSDAGAYDEDGTRRICRVWFSIGREPLGCKRNPYWNDRCPLLSAPVEKIAGVFKGKSLIEAVAPLQYEANDAANECADADHFGAMPIIARKPGVSTAPLILNLAAIWDVGPDDIKFMEFPDLSARAIARIQRAMTAIFQDLGVNPAMIPQSSSGQGGKRNQAAIANEQAVDLLTTAEAVSVIDEAIMTPAVEWAVDLDHQFRGDDITVRAYGEMGVRAQMIDVPVLQNRTRYAFTWAGAQQMRNAQMFQQQIAWLNVARGMIADLKAQGYQLNVAPALEASALSIFGAKTAPLILVDQRRQLTIDPHIENRMLDEGHDVPAHTLDNDAEHLQVHAENMKETGDPHGNGRVHVAQHLEQMKLKMAAQVQEQMKQQMQPGAQGVPGGAAAGVAGTPRAGGPPRMGAQPAMPRRIKQPPGAIHPDQMPRAGAVPMPRRM